MIPPLLHLYWGPSRPLSLLRYMTVKTFAALNPEWEITVWRPLQKGLSPNWPTKEHKAFIWSGIDWAERLEEIPGVKVKVSQAQDLLEDFPPLAEVHVSDLLRWRILAEKGGWWSDFDILYFRPMDAMLSRVDLTSDCLLCWGEVPDLKGWGAIGFQAAAPGNRLFREMASLGLEIAHYSRILGYQDLGELLLKRFVSPEDADFEGEKIGHIPQSVVYPFKDVRGQQPGLWTPKMTSIKLEPHTVGIHWYGGQQRSAEREAIILKESDIGSTRGVVAQAYRTFEARNDSFIQEIEAVSTMLETIAYSIILPYINRADQLWNTLVSLHHWYGGRTDWEVILVEDIKCSTQDRSELKNILAHWRKKGLMLNHLEQQGKADQCNPSLLFNLGAKEAKGEILILSSPEIFHATNVLAGFDEEFSKDENAYVICACKNFVPGSIRGRIAEFDRLRGRRDTWLQHSLLRPVNYHWCSALTRKNWDIFGGFDEAFADGYCFDDDDFRELVRAAGLRFILRDDLMVLHQSHRPGPKPADYMDRWHRNKRLYESKWGAYTPMECVPCQKRA